MGGFLVRPAPQGMKFICSMEREMVSQILLGLLLGSKKGIEQGADCSMNAVRNFFPYFTGLCGIKQKNKQLENVENCQRAFKKKLFGILANLDSCNFIKENCTKNKTAKAGPERPECRFYHPM